MQQNTKRNYFNLQHYYVPNIMAPWGTKMCKNAIYYNLYPHDFFLSQISNCGLERQINKWWVFVPNIMEGTVVNHSYTNHNMHNIVHIHTLLTQYILAWWAFFIWPVIVSYY